jgi:hypothetical protein
VGRGAGLVRFLVAALLLISVPQPALAASAPTGVSIAAPVDPIALGTTVSATGAFTDPDSTTSFTTTAGAANTTINVRSAALDPVTLNFRTEQEVRGGLTVNMLVTSSNPSVGSITLSPIPFIGGTGVNKTTAFDPASAGTAIISIPTPVPGFFTISNQSAIVTATVNP